MSRRPIADGKSTMLTVRVPLDLWLDLAVVSVPLGDRIHVSPSIAERARYVLRLGMEAARRR